MTGRLLRGCRLQSIKSGMKPIRRKPRMSAHQLSFRGCKKNDRNWKMKAFLFSEELINAVTRAHAYPMRVASYNSPQIVTDCKHQKSDDSDVIFV